MRQSRFSPGGCLGPALVAAITAAVNGVIGNRTDAGFLWFWPYLLSFSRAVLSWQWLGYVLFVLLLLVSFAQGRQITVLQRLAELDDSLLGLLPELVAADDPHSVMRPLLTQFLRDTTTIFSQELNRASILIPRGEWLQVYVTYGMPAESIERTKFYIGPEPHRLRGVAGTAFVTRTTRIAHMFSQRGDWQSDDPTYIDFEPRRPRLPYRSFVAIPILDGPDTCLGVLCFDSLSRTSFDSRAIRDNILPALATRTLAAILIYRSVVEDRSHGVGGRESEHGIMNPWA